MIVSRWPAPSRSFFAFTLPISTKLVCSTIRQNIMLHSPFQQLGSDSASSSLYLLSCLCSIGSNYGYGETQRLSIAKDKLFSRVKKGKYLPEIKRHNRMKKGRLGLWLSRWQLRGKNQKWLRVKPMPLPKVKTKRLLFGENAFPNPSLLRLTN